MLEHSRNTHDGQPPDSHKHICEKPGCGRAYLRKPDLIKHTHKNHPEMTIELSNDNDQPHGGPNILGEDSTSDQPVPTATDSQTELGDDNKRVVSYTSLPP